VRIREDRIDEGTLQGAGPRECSCSESPGHS